MTCVVEDCQGRVINKSRMLCNKHYLRWQRRHSLHDPVPAPRYEAMHARLKYERGPAKGYDCVSCGQQAAHWAYDGQDPDERTNPPNWGTRKDNLYFSMDPSHYQAMCAKCHKRLDIKIAAQRKNSKIYDRTLT